MLILVSISLTAELVVLHVKASHALADPHVVQITLKFVLSHFQYSEAAQLKKCRREDTRNQIFANHEIAQAVPVSY